MTATPRRVRCSKCGRGEECPVVQGLTLDTPPGWRTITVSGTPMRSFLLCPVPCAESVLSELRVWR